MFKPASLLSITTLALIASPLAASAADLGYGGPVTAMQVVPCWTGFYVGLGGGIASLNTALKAQPGPALGGTGASGASASFDGLGAGGGFFELNAGADYQVNSWLVVGGFFDFDFDDFGSTLNINVPGAPFQAQAKINVDNKWSIGGRVGYLASPGTLLFVSGGFTQVNTSDLKLAAGGPFPTTAAAINVPSFSGGFVGAGSETQLTEHFSLRGEYRFTDFGSGKLGFPTVDGMNLNDFASARASSTMQDGRVSINYRF
jgi:outer membrane immunogenic protein